MHLGPQETGRSQSQSTRPHAHLSPHSLADNAGVAAELADEARELEQRVEPVEDAHVAEADLLDELELELLGEVLRLRQLEERAHDVEAAVARGPELLDDGVGRLDVVRVRVRVRVWVRVRVRVRVS